MMNKVQEWTDVLNQIVNRYGWLPFDGIGDTLYDGVQSWAKQGYVGVTGMLCPPQNDYNEDGNPNHDGIRWTVINDEERDNRVFNTAEDAMRFAEELRPDLFQNEED